MPTLLCKYTTVCNCATGKAVQLATCRSYTAQKWLNCGQVGLCVQLLEPLSWHVSGIQRVNTDALSQSHPILCYCIHNNLPKYKIRNFYISREWNWWWRSALLFLHFLGYISRCINRRHQVIEHGRSPLNMTILKGLSLGLTTIIKKNKTKQKPPTKIREIENYTKVIRSCEQ